MLSNLKIGIRLSIGFAIALLPADRRRRHRRHPRR
jgi:hypothetical protein